MSSNGVDQDLGAQAHGKVVAFGVELGKLLAELRELKNDITDRIQRVANSAESTQRQVNALTILVEAFEKRSEKRHQELLALLGAARPKVRRLPKAGRSG